MFIVWDKRDWNCVDLLNLSKYCMHWMSIEIKICALKYFWEKYTSVWWLSWHFVERADFIWHQLMWFVIETFTHNWETLSQKIIRIDSNAIRKVILNYLHGTVYFVELHWKQLPQSRPVYKDGLATALLECSVLNTKMFVFIFSSFHSGI